MKLICFLKILAAWLVSLTDNRELCSMIMVLLDLTQCFIFTCPPNKTLMRICPQDPDVTNDDVTVWILSMLCTYVGIVE